MTGVTQLEAERCPALTKTLIFAFYETILSAGHLNRVSLVNDVMISASDISPDLLFQSHQSLHETLVDTPRGCDCSLQESMVY